MNSVFNNASRKKAPFAGPSFVYLAGPALTLLVLLVSMAWCGIYPFGDHAYLARDGAIQYVGFYGWYHNVLTGQANLFYSLSKGLGGATFGLFAYYLSSPLALLAVFFDASDSAKLFSLLVPIKLVLASFTCGYALIKRTGNHSVALSLLGCAYALSAYSFTDGLNVMWLDGMALLPLAVLGVYRLVTAGSVGLMFASCTVSIICNWYIGYMICLFCVLWFFVELVLRGEGSVKLAGDAVIGQACDVVVKQRREGTGKRDAGTPSISACFARFAAVMVLVVGAGCVILLPVVVEQLQSSGLGGDSGYFATIAEGVSWLDVRQFLAALVNPEATFAGSTNAVSVPWVLLALAMCFFALPAAGSARRKVVLGVVLAIFIVSFLFKPLDMVWTGFVRADSYNPRYYFLFLFVLCLCAAWAINAFSAAILRKFVCAAVAIALALGTGALAVLGFSETDLNGYSSNSVSRYQSYMQQLLQAHEQAEQSSGTGVVRMENAASSSVMAMRTTEPVSTVDTLSNMMTTGEYMALGDSSLSHYSSTADGSMKELLGSLGYCLLPGSRGISTYHSPVLLTDSVLGVEYVLSNSKPAGTSEVSGSYSLPGSEGEDVRLYRNGLALGLGFAVSAQAQSVAWGSNPFDNQMQWLSELSGQDASDVYVSARVISSAAQGTYANDATEVTSYVWDIFVDETGPLYLWVAAAPAGTRVNCNGEFLQTTRSYEFDTNIIYLGEYKAGDSVNVQLTSPVAASIVNFDVQAASLDTDRATALLNGMRASQFELSTYEDGHISGTFSAKADEKLLLTVPATKGWTAKVDGVPVDVENLNGLISLNVVEGNHVIELSYETPGLWAGIAVSAVSLALFAVWMVFRSRCKRDF